MLCDHGCLQGILPTLCYLPGAEDCGGEYVAESPAPGALYLGFHMTEAGLVLLLYLVYVIWTWWGLDLTFLVFPPTPTFGVQKVPSQASAPENTHAYTHAHTAEEN